MTEESKNNRNTVLVVLDIAKKTHDAIIALPSGKTIKLRVPNSLYGYQHLLEKASQGDYRIQVAFEPTADYNRNIAYWLNKQGCQCFLVVKT